MNTLGINTSHDASVALCENGKIIQCFDESRFKRIKHFLPEDAIERKQKVFTCMENIDISKVDRIIVSSFDRRENDTLCSDEEVNNYISNELGKSVEFNIEHHLYHAYCGNYFSKFNDAICIVLDGGGARLHPSYISYQEIESIFVINDWNIERKWVHLSDNLPSIRNGIPPNYTLKETTLNNFEVKLSSELSSGQDFSVLAETIGWSDGGRSSGKVMGLAPYANGVTTGYGAENLAERCQQESFERTKLIIEKAMTYSNSKNIIISGGYALNCTNNFRYTQEFPEYNFFIDPVAHDVGTAIGAALWGYYDNK